MTCEEYIEAVHKASYEEFHEHFWPESVNGAWSIDGTEWYPCVILDDPAPNGTVHIVTRNQSHIHVSAMNVRRKEQFS